MCCAVAHNTFFKAFCEKFSFTISNTLKYDKNNIYRPFSCHRLLEFGKIHSLRAIFTLDFQSFRLKIHKITTYILNSCAVNLVMKRLMSRFYANFLANIFIFYFQIFYLKKYEKNFFFFNACIE
jgi:hypothetical protein